MKNKLNLFIWLGISALITGCGNVISSPPESIQETPYSGSSQSHFLTSTSVVTTEVAGTDSKMVCPNTETILNEDDVDKGSILFVDYDDYKIISLDLRTEVKNPFTPSSEKVYSYSLSPNGKWLAYEAENTSTSEKQLIIRKSSGETMARIPWENRWAKISYWLDNSRVVIKMGGDNLPSILILNPFSDEQEEFLLDFPGIYTFQYAPDWNGSGQAIYNSILDRVVFAGINNEYIMWDVVNRKSLTSLRAISFLQFPTKAPQWSSDSGQVVIAAPNKSVDYMNDELFSINRDGSVEKLTNFADYYSRVSINRYNWSPDGNYVAMLFSASPSEYSGEQLAILNYYTRALSIYCIQGDMTNDYRRSSQGYYDEIIYKGIVWSSSSHQLIVENRVTENASRIILIDITRNIAYQIANKENIQPFGWTVNEP